MIKFFNDCFAYFFFRINQLWLKVGYKNAQHATGILAMLQTFILVDIFIIVYTNSFTSVKEYRMPTFFYYSFIVLFFILFYYNLKKYSYNYFIYLKRWENEDKSKRVMKGILIILLIISIPFIGVIYLDYWNQ